eukprot:XP_025003209.1 uncharacterized protein LOC101749671 [Gallus gallus]
MSGLPGISISVCKCFSRCAAPLGEVTAAVDVTEADDDTAAVGGRRRRLATGRCHFADRCRNAQASGRWGRPYPGTGRRGAGAGSCRVGLRREGGCGGCGVRRSVPKCQAWDGVPAPTCRPEAPRGSSAARHSRCRRRCPPGRDPRVRVPPGPPPLRAGAALCGAAAVVRDGRRAAVGTGTPWRGCAAGCASDVPGVTRWENVFFATSRWLRGRCANRDPSETLCVLSSSLAAPVRGARRGWGAATRRYANHIRPRVFQHTAGAGGGGGMGASTQRNTNLLQPAVFQHTAGGGGGWGAPAAVTQPPVIANSTSGGSGDGGGLSGASGFGPAGNNGAVLSQNAFSALSSAQPADGQRDGQQSLLDVIAEDMATWESSGQWMFSCYSPETGKPNVPGFGEFSAEEVRLEYYNCSANNNTGYYINSVNQLVQQWRKRLQELKALNGSGKAPMQNGGGGGGGMGHIGWQR